MKAINKVSVPEYWRIISR